MCILKSATVCLLLAFLVFAGSANMQSTAFADGAQVDNRHLMVPPKNADGSVKSPPFLQDPVLWARDEQQNIYGSLSHAMKQMRDDKAWASALSLMLLSFGYGVFHAAGPGHGKAVISAWLLATENELRRGILVALMSAVVQAVTAVVLVSAVLLLVSGAASTARDMAAYLESASFALIAGMGIYLLWTGIKALGVWPRWHSANSTAFTTSGSGHHFELVNMPPDANSGAHVHGPDCDCGHVHLPAAAEVAENWSWGRAFSLAFAVGLRPCTGALLVLIFANSIGIYWAGVVSTFVMAIGTFLTVSLAAGLAVYSRKLAERMVARDTRWMGYLSSALRLSGGVAIFLFGAILFMASLNGPVSGM